MLDTRGDSCSARGNTSPGVSVTGASSARASRRKRLDVLDSDDIARLTATPARTVRWRLARWHDAGGPVQRVSRKGGGWRYLVAVEAYAARLGLRADDVRAA